MPYYFFGNLDTSQIFSSYKDFYDSVSKKDKFNSFIISHTDYNVCSYLQQLYQKQIIDNQQFLYFWNPKKYVYMYTDASVLYKKDIQAAGYGFYIENNLHQQVGLQRDIETEIQKDNPGPAFILSFLQKYSLTFKIDDKDLLNNLRDSFSRKLKASDINSILVCSFELLSVYRCILEYSKNQFFNQIPIVFTDSQFVINNLMLYDFFYQYPPNHNIIDFIKFEINKNLLKKTFFLVQKFNIKIIKIQSHVTEKPSSKKSLQYQRRFPYSSIDIFLNGNAIADQLAKHAMQISIYQKNN